MAKQYLVIGAGQFGSSLARALQQAGHEVVVIDRREAVLEDIMQEVSQAIVLDASDSKSLEKLGIAQFDSVIVAIGDNLEASILATVAAKQAGAKHLISKADREITAQVLASVGADEVVRPEHDMGQRLARQLTSPDVLDRLSLGSENGIIELEVGGNLCGQLSDLRLPNRFGVQVIAVNREAQFHISPGADFEVQLGDHLVIIGSNANLSKLQKFLSR